MRIRALSLPVFGGAILRTLLVSGLFFATLPAAHADFLKLSFSGTFATALGAIQAGDTFSGDIEWDSASTTNLCPGSLKYGQCIPILSNVLTLPSADGLSIPGATVTFAGIPEVTAGIVDFSKAVPQINIVSSTDGNIYSLFVTPGGVSVEDDATLKGEAATNFTSSGPAAVPEPNSFSLAVLALLLPVSLVARRRRQTR